MLCVLWLPLLSRRNRRRREKTKRELTEREEAKVDRRVAYWNFTRNRAPHWKSSSNEVIAKAVFEMHMQPLHLGLTKLAVSSPPRGVACTSAYLDVPPFPCHAASSASHSGSQPPHLPLTRSLTNAALWEITKTASPL